MGARSPHARRARSTDGSRIYARKMADPSVDLRPRREWTALCRRLSGWVHFPDRSRGEEITHATTTADAFFGLGHQIGDGRNDVANLCGSEKYRSQRSL